MTRLEKKNGLIATDDKKKGGGGVRDTTHTLLTRWLQTTLLKPNIGDLLQRVGGVAPEPAEESASASSGD